jgi:hypothetical protein
MTLAGYKRTGAVGDIDKRRLHEHRLMELLPALAPIVRDLGGGHIDERLTGCGLQVGQLRQLTRGAVHGVFDNALSPILHGKLDLLDSGGRDLEQLGEHELGVCVAHPQREADHAAW